MVIAMTTVPAAAAPRRLSGTLSKPGYTVIALAANGEARSVKATTGPFELRPPANRVTLHLRAPDGTYAGPIVVGGAKRGKVSLLGVMGGAKLGQIEILNDYAKPSRRPSSRVLASSFRSRARKGVPIGVRRFGRVISRKVRSSVPGDLDVDGIPNPLDIDDDGDRILDNLDRRRNIRARRASVADATRQEFAFELNLNASIDQTANANASGMTDQQMDALLSTNGGLLFDIVSGGTSELDCGGLIYCTSGGTGRRIQPGSGADLGAFPECCDADSDGFGTITASTVLRHGATRTQIGTGDVLVQRVTSGGTETQYAATLQYVFASVPALVSYDDGQGNSATVSYPVAAPVMGIGGGPGTHTNPFVVKAGSNGDVVLNLTLWRPQRRPIAPEAGDWIDIGRLVYEMGGGNTGRDCPQDAYSTNQALTPMPGPSGEGEDESGGLLDQAPDRPASPVNEVILTVNLSECLRARRTDVPDESWSVGETKMFSISATDRKAYATQDLHFKLQ